MFLVIEGDYQELCRLSEAVEIPHRLGGVHETTKPIEYEGARVPSGTRLWLLVSGSPTRTDQIGTSLTHP